MTRGRLGMKAQVHPLPCMMRYCKLVCKLHSWLAGELQGISSRMQHKEMIQNRTDKTMCRAS